MSHTVQFTVLAAALVIATSLLAAPAFASHPCFEDAGPCDCCHGSECPPQCNTGGSSGAGGVGGTGGSSGGTGGSGGGTGGVAGAGGSIGGTGGASSGGVGGSNAGAAGAAGTGESGDEAGCGCSIVARGAPWPAWIALGLTAAWLGRRRRSGLSDVRPLEKHR